jgi:hypothetical protein
MKTEEPTKEFKTYFSFEIIKQLISESPQITI